MEIDEIKTSYYLNKYDRVILMVTITRGGRTDIIIDGEDSFTDVATGNVSEKIKETEKRYSLKVALGDLDKYNDVVYSGKPGDYEHFCPKCGANVRDMDCLGESGYYDRTCYMVCKCGSHLLDFG